ncbi:hypothetical protein [Xanthomonas hortorum]|uniref:Uncharacterized protein n=1 Tax=Xanthomonas hortorum pv. gardneri TaxID=2754056 RepID=A0A6V7E9Q0_9XANT|nr:hypothetical protein [Xanthomonas hortorum]APP79744.1 hypothetical protein BJD10_08550 [Xanthomonas hortorum pv. gardneri]EGD21226.1 hypothetical protein XGA_0118 [Xanthomonas hortorum ATCC 19865]KLA94599.1 hypothetical protein SM19410_17775 [Xanthomonas hortorum pv. gardneri]KLA99231.1 hypothetical protein SM17710_10380 [Xanthomonas hortorum pv. gardneri]KLB04166.1 hypothetical protein SM18210_08065 [Xanthomonas hortorum pv. gardneri]
MGYKITGELTLLGDAQFSANGVRQYSVIEIGNKVYSKHRAPAGINTYLQRAVRMNGQTSLYVEGNFIYGVTLPDGRTYCWKKNPIGSMVMMGLGIIGLPFIGIGLILIIAAFKELAINSGSNALLKHGALRI